MDIIVLLVVVLSVYGAIYLFAHLIILLLELPEKLKRYREKRRKLKQHNKKYGICVNTKTNTWEKL